MDDRTYRCGSGFDDILVVGAGTAGCVIAGRLAAAGATVTLVEAGRDYGPRDTGRWPEELLAAWSLPESHDWGLTERLADGRVIALHRGRVIGGCSSVNGCVAAWGAAADYDGWAATGLDDWSAAAMEPRLQEANAALGVRTPSRSEITPFQSACLDAALALGFAWLDDTNALTSDTGTGTIPSTTTSDSVRINAAFAFLDSQRASGRLRILDRRVVDRLEIRAGRVKAVALNGPNGWERLTPGAVVLAAGVYGSPAILLRSGVGERGTSEALGIPGALTLPGVGRNLHDHPTVDVTFSGTRELRAAMTEWCVDRQMADEPIVVKARASLPSDAFDLHVFPVSITPYEGRPWKWVLPVAALTPESRGQVTLTSRNPDVAPRIDHGFLSDPSGADLRRLADGVALTRELAADPALRAVLGDEIEPGPGAGLEQWIRAHHNHYWHPVGTCAMGVDPAAGAVTDPQGRVHGLVNCFVADASIMPTIPRANTAVPTAGVACRIADAVAESL